MGARQPLLTTNHVRDFHQVVVHDVCQVIHWRFISTLIEHLVIQDITHHLHVATNHISSAMNLLSWFNFETYCILLTVCDELIYLFLEKQDELRICIRVWASYWKF